MKRRVTTLAIALSGVLVLGHAAYAARGNCPARQDKAKTQACGGGVCASKQSGAGRGAQHRHGQSSTERPTLSVNALAGLLKADAVPVLLDARSGKYDDGRRIPGAKALAAGVAAEKASEVIPSKDTLVVTYCANVKCPASAKLAAHLEKLGYTNIIEFPAGIDGWVDAGHSVEQVN